MVFATLSPTADRALQQAGAVYHPWPDDEGEPGTGGETATGGVRLVCSWSTQAAEVDRMIEVVTGAAATVASRG
jgi:threonine aldolase